MREQRGQAVAAADKIIQVETEEFKLGEYQTVEVFDRGGERCAGAPCWQALGSSGFRYKDGSASASGVQQLDFVAGGAGRGKASAKGRNDAGKGMASLPTGVAFRLYGESHPTLQLATEHGFCLSAKVTTM